VVKIRVEKPDELKDWMTAFDEGTGLINDYCPGLQLVRSDDGDSPILVIGSDYCSTTGIVFKRPRPVKIKLELELTEAQEYFVVHELLHALGFEHENQRRDAENYLSFDEDANKDMKPKAKYRAMTPYDPFSIMHAPVGLEIQRLRDSSKKGPPDGEQNEKMSELDKVALNMLYPPVISWAATTFPGTVAFLSAHKEVPTARPAVCCPSPVECAETSGKVDQAGYTAGEEGADLTMAFLVVTVAVWSTWEINKISL